MKSYISAILMFLAAGCATGAGPTGSVLKDCADCGTVRSIEPINQGSGKASGAGAIMGAVIGGVVGHQFGSGRGQDAATAGGAAAGAVTGHEMEKRRNAGGTVYQVLIDMDRGLTESITVADPGGLRHGDRVRVLGRNIQRIE